MCVPPTIPCPRTWSSAPIVIVFGYLSVCEQFGAASRGCCSSLSCSGFIVNDDPTRSFRAQVNRASLLVFPSL